MYPGSTFTSALKSFKKKTRVQYRIACDLCSKRKINTLISLEPPITRTTQRLSLSARLKGSQADKLLLELLSGTRYKIARKGEPSWTKTPICCFKRQRGPRFGRTRKRPRTIKKLCGRSFESAFTETR